MKKNISALIDQLELIHFGKTWIGVNFQKKIENLTTNEFFYKVDGLHSIAEIIAHLTTWRLETILKIKTRSGSITDDDPSNWVNNEALKKLGKEVILNAHYESLSELITLLKKENDEFLENLYFDNDFKGDYPYKFVIQGMLHHDLYHLGQIGMLLKFLKGNP